MPKVDVIIPTFNRETWVPKAVESVLNQTFKDFRLFVIDDGSTDNTEVILEKYKSDPRFYYQKIKNSGVSKARNQAVLLGSSPWISFLDSDDQWTDDKLSRQFQALGHDPEFQIIHGEEIWIRNGKRVNPKKKHQKSGGDIYERSLKLCLMSPSAIMIKRDLFNEFGGFDEEFIVCEDYDLWLKLTANHQVAFVESPIVIKHGGHEDQLSTKYKAMDWWRVKSMINIINSDLLKLQPEKYQATLKEIIKKSEILELGFEKHGNFQAAKESSEIISWATDRLFNALPL